MAITKQILILANSIKKGGRCVAGRELITGKDGRKFVGPWIRPIDPSGDEGTIDLMKAKLGGRFIRPLEVIKIPLIGCADDPNHPEDWHIDPAIEWEKTGAYPIDILNSLHDDSGDLWGNGTAASRKVAPRQGLQTLKLIKPADQVLVRAFREDTPWGVKHRRYLNIRHEGVVHTFSIDDPLFAARHPLDPASVGDREVRIPLDPAKTFIVASLTPPFNGFHYKIAATIFER
jgi:hypothetical protein